MVFTTSTMRSRPWTRASMRSPTSTIVAGLAVRALMRTWPARHAVVASARDLNRRMDHNHRSTRTPSAAAPSRGMLDSMTAAVEVDRAIPFERLELGAGAWVDVARGWLAGADELFEHLR